MLAAGMFPSPVAVATPVETGATQACNNAAQLVTDVTVPDNTILRPGRRSPRRGVCATPAAAHGPRTTR